MAYCWCINRNRLYFYVLLAYLCFRLNITIYNPSLILNYAQRPLRIQPMVLQTEQGKAPEEAEGALQEKPGKNKGIPQEIQEQSQEQEETEVTPEEIYSKTASQRGRQEEEKGKLGLVQEISPGILPQE